MLAGSFLPLFNTWAAGSRLRLATVRLCNLAREDARFDISLQTQLQLAITAVFTQVTIVRKVAVRRATTRDEGRSLARDVSGA